MEKKVNGRPTKYVDRIHDPLVYELARDNYPIDMIATKYLKIAPSTFHEWLNKYKSFSENYKQGLNAKLDKVESNLYQRSAGITTVELVEVKGKDGEVERTERRTKQLPPDVGACMAILKTQRRAKWAESYILDDSGCENLKTLADVIKNSLEDIKDDD